MYARVTISETSPDKVDLAIKVITVDIIPAAKKVPGFKGGYWLGDKVSGKGVTITLFESEEALKNSEDVTKQIRSDAAKKIGAAIQSVERFEVLAQA